MVGLWIFVMASILVIQRILELYIANNNYKWAVDAGAQEFGKDHYPLFFILHIGWFIGWIVEGSVGGNVLSKLWYLWVSLFVFAQVVRYWCIASLGKSWNTRVLVIPGKRLISKGPYQYIKHPNYVAVGIELLVVPLIFGATITAVIATLCNLGLTLGIRIPVEEKALRDDIIENNT
ncbi:MAG: Isoprenylcysteine carboxyl methyltransferase [Pelosinus sp.]|jgi:methyltransferase|nr:Isoprenylcysteine carboxyl methyltransferase [Pelosinus sp.]